MESSERAKSGQKIDVDRILYSKNARLSRMVPRFITNWLKRIVHQDELNAFLNEYGHLHDAELIGTFLTHFQISYNIFGSENIPKTGRNFFVSNHPLGGLDGLVFIYELSKYYKELRFPVNKHGLQGRDAALKIEEAYASDSQILYFPAGLCSRKKKGVIKDLTWHKSVIAKAVQHKRDVIPAFISGRNSDFFYSLSNLRKAIGIKTNIEMLYLPDEMFKQKGKEISLVFGAPIPWQTFDKSLTYPEWAEWVKSKSYELESIIS